MTHPELIPLLLFCEKLTSDEFLLVDNLLTLPPDSPGSGKSCNPVLAEQTLSFVDRLDKVEYPSIFNEVLCLQSQVFPKHGLYLGHHNRCVVVWLACGG